jgi:GNAT superfamily N-acetyltransferase
MEPVSFDAVDPREPEAQAALSRYVSEVFARVVNGTRMSPGDGVEAFGPPGGAFLLARTGGKVIGCGAVRALGPGIGEIKRMWIEPGSRGQGLRSRLLLSLEDAARGLGYQRIRLDTNEALVEAIHLYETGGIGESTATTTTPTPHTSSRSP